MTGVSVVVATRNRPERLRALLDSLAAQAGPAFELIVVDDASDVPVAAGRARVIRLPVHGGPGPARNAGWRAAGGDLIAFIDDDCTAQPGWLAALAAAHARDADAVIQGRTEPDPAEAPRLAAFTRSQSVTSGPGPWFQTCNIAYPRALLERLGGFDAAAFPTTGEDCDLAWRAIEAGAHVTFAPDAHVRHAVVQLDWRGMLRRAWRWGDAMPAFARHPELRRRRLIHRLFFNWSHWYLLRLLVALWLPRRRAFWPLKYWLAHRYFEDRRWLPGSASPSVQALAWNLLVDSVEIAGVIRGSLRSGTLVL